MERNVVITCGNATLYFAYGSNMDEDQMARRCPNSRPFDIGELYGYALRMDAAGYAAIVEHEGSVVEGVLWTLDAEDEKTLDRYEGVACGCYEKKRMPVRLPGGEVRDALVYVSLRPPFEKKTHREDYLARVMKAAGDFQLNAWALPQLHEIARESGFGQDKSNVTEELEALRSWLLHAQPLVDGKLWGGVGLVIATPEMLESGEVGARRGYDAIVSRYAHDVSQALFAVKESMLRCGCYDRAVFISVGSALDERICSGRHEREDLIHAVFDAALKFVE